MSKRKEQKQQEEQAIPTLEEFESGMLDDIDDVAKGFRERASREAQRFEDVCDTDYYFVVVFSNKTQLMEFCDKFGVDFDDLYVDGRKWARKLGKKIECQDSVFPKIQPVNKDYAARARNFTDNTVKQKKRF